MGPSNVLLVGTAVLVAGVAAARFADRLGAPALLLFLGMGILIGEDGPGGVHFDDAHLTEQVALVCLAVILFEGGLTADVRAMRRVIKPAVMLASVGVVVTGAVCGVAATLLLDLSLKQGLLVGAVISSTDAAAVFGALRGAPVTRRLAAILEGESGLNDPIAAVLVILLVDVITKPDYTLPNGAALLAQQAVLGLLGGIAFCWLSRLALERASFSSAGLYPVAALASALGCFVFVSWVGGSGFLAVYILGLYLGGLALPYAGIVEGFHQGLAWLAQLTLFVLLGLLVTPSRLVDEGIEPFAIAVVLVLVARPLAVIASVPWFGITVREQTFLAWAGLRGGVPIVFATFPVVAGVDDGRRIFDVVFYVVLVSVIVQGIGLRPVAHWLVLAREQQQTRPGELDTTTLRALGAELVELDVGEAGLEAGKAIRETPLPGGGVVTAIRRGQGIVQPRGGTVLEQGDRVYLLVQQDQLEKVEAALRRSRS
jgi:potassium/hydrogen antiporter